MTPKSRILFIHNPVSGVKKLNKLEDMVRHHLDPEKFEYEVRETESPKDAMRLASAAVQEKFDIVVAVGGDGTINEIVHGMGTHPLVLGIIPTGSGNGLARHLGIPLEPEKAIRAINKMNIRNIDTATINGYPFVSIAGLGFDARVADKYAKVKHRGFFGYLRIVLQEFFRYREREYILTFNDQKITRKALLISIANSNQFGYNIVISPTAKTDDGLLDIVITRKFPIGELARMIGLLFTNKIDQSGFFETHKSSEIFIVRKRGKRVNIDGEAIKMGREIFVRIQPASLKVIV